MNKRILWITETAMLIALIVVAQLLQKVIPAFPIGPVKLSQLVTGSIVNLVLIVGAFTPGLASAATAAAVSPILAAFFGIIPGQLPQMVPVVMAGNLTIVFITWLCFRASKGLGSTSAAVLNVVGVAAGAALKAFIMWAATEKIIVPLFNVGAKLEKALVGVVTVPQVITALVGGILALLLMPALKGFAKGR